MPNRTYHFHSGRNGAALAIRVKPRAKNNKIDKFLNDGTIKINLTAPPVNGKANEALLKFLSEVLKVPIRNLEIVAGSRGRDKLISITGMDPFSVQKRIMEIINNESSME